MSTDLGFETIFDLKEWTGQVPEIWGNPNGPLLFCDEKAYNGASTLKEVVDYLKTVRDRSPE